MREMFLENQFALRFDATPGLSTDARPVKEEGSMESRRSPSVLHGRAEQSIFEALRSTFVRAGGQGWDGYDAAPVNATALSYALQLLHDLPQDVTVPEIGADADGDVSLDWDYGPRQIFSVRIGRDGTVHYAGLFGHATYHGSETLGRGIPRTVAEGIRRAIRAA